MISPPLIFWKKEKKVNEHWSKVKALFAQSHLTLCNLVDCSPPVSSVHSILQARTLAIPFSRGSFWPRDQTQVLLHCRQILYCLSHQGSHILSLWITTESNAKLSCTNNFSAGRLLSNVWALPRMVHPAAFESNTWKEVSRVCYMGWFAWLNLVIPEVSSPEFLSQLPLSPSPQFPKVIQQTPQSSLCWEGSWECLALRRLSGRVNVHIN